MKICLIGNSHASGAYSLIKNGISTFEIDFFLERSSGNSCLKVIDDSEDEVVEIEDVMLTRLAPVKTSRYDAFAIYSMGFSFGRCVEIYRDYAPDAYRNEKAKYLVSDDFFDAAIESILLESKAVRIMRALRSFSDRPIILVPQPLPLEWAVTRSLRRTEVFAEALKKDFLEHVFKVYATVIDKLRREGFVVLEQPRETLTLKYFTLSEFGLADPADDRPDSLYARGDFFHANQAYAKIVLKDLEAELAN